METRKLVCFYFNPKIVKIDIPQFGRGRGGGRGGGQRAPRPDYQEVQKHNDLYEGYYNELGITGEEERDEFWAALRRELPNSFRFTGSKG